MGAHIRIIGVIDEDAYREFSERLDALEASDLGESVRVAITSSGGSAYIALAFASRIRLSPLRITTTAVGFVASAATLILAAGAIRYITKESWVMVHEDSAEITGTVTEAEKEIKHSRALEVQWNQLLEQYTGTPAKVWESIHSSGDTYLSPEECLELGLVNEIV